MLPIDINCDLGEGFTTDELIMPYITSANIACTYHAGNEESMRNTVLLAVKHKVNIGAHPSFLDKENFGRTELKTSPKEVYDLVRNQLVFLQKVVAENNTVLHHVKPHGALYNIAAKDSTIAKAICRAVKDFNQHLKIYGLSNSCMITEANAIRLTAMNEVFADRTYQDDGSLTPRSLPNALIEDENKAVEQVLQMVQYGTVKTVSGKQIPIQAETVCIHGDGKYAVQFAQRLNKDLGNLSSEA
jgi:UPF0271 protein